ncbi:hypothetical protein MMC24_000619 [Lignoscripta atroalba]|nr:hypothetical protein [Lignoscripta atroalba]
MSSTHPPILLLDGGLGTTLECPPYNIHFSAATPLWSSHLPVSSPDTLLAAQKSFVDSGADVLLTGTYQASFEGFQSTSLRGEGGVKRNGYGRAEAGALMRNAVVIARKAFEASSRRAVEGEKEHTKNGHRVGIVALSLGAYGATMRPSQEYTGAYLPSEMKTTEGLSKWHMERLAVFAEDAQTWSDIDYVAFETLPLLREIEAARKIMAEVNSGTGRKRWWISCVFPNENPELPDGSSVENVVETMLTDRGKRWQQPWGIGINCTKVEKLAVLIAQFEEAVQKLLREGKLEERSLNHSSGWPWLVIYPDGAQGLVYNTTAKVWESPDGAEVQARRKYWDEEVFEVVKGTRERALWAGIMVGGCCKTAPEDIGRLHARIDELR